MDLPAFRFFDRLTERTVADLETCREQSIPVAGVYCVYAPGELIRAAGAVPVGLCGKKEAPIRFAEETLPASLCPLIKSSYGYAVSGTCPFFAASDFVVAETTCDGKKKMYEFMERIKPVHLMHLPYSRSLPDARAYWRSELRRLADFLQEKTGIRADDDRLRYQIRLHNRMREEMLAVTRLMSASEHPAHGNDLLTLLESKGFVVDLEAYVDALAVLREELEAAALSISRKPRARVLLTGCPVGKGCEKVIQLIEEAGASVVCMENCTGMKSLMQPVDETGDPLDALADRYLQIPCSCMTPNDGRIDSIRDLAGQFQADALVDLTWQFCHTYNIEAHAVAAEIQADPGLPCLHLETNYSPSDTEQLKTRIEAFLEIIDQQ